ncbi:MAG: SdpI family protein [Gammaproteobacteria bacterium]
MKMLSLTKLDVLSVALVAFTLLLIWVFYPQLPDQIPVHWNSAGEIDKYSSKAIGLLMMPAVALGTILLMKILPAISPDGFKLDESRHVLGIIQAVLVALFCAIGIATILISLGYKLDMVKVVLIGSGLMLMATGNVLSKVRKNFFVGIRTPWTLADDEVWSRTHRLAGRTFFGGGLLVCVLALIKPNPVLLLVGVSVAVLLPVVHSFVVYRQLNPKDGG